jgi:hypothetical protein
MRMIRDYSYFIFLSNNQRKRPSKYSGMDGVAIFKFLNKEPCVQI